MTTILSRSSEQDMRVLSKAVTSVGRELDLSQVTLARVIGVSQSSISRMREGNFEFKPDSKPREFALMLVKIYRSLEMILGDAATEKAWMHGFNKELGGVPAELILKTEGLVNVVNYLDAYRAGI